MRRDDSTLKTVIGTSVPLPWNTRPAPRLHGVEQAFPADDEHLRNYFGGTWRLCVDLHLKLTHQQ
jgi:hypothetical protein